MQGGLESDSVSFWAQLARMLCGLCCVCSLLYKVRDLQAGGKDAAVQAGARKQPKRPAADVIAALGLPSDTALAQQLDALFSRKVLPKAAARTELNQRRRSLRPS